MSILELKQWEIVRVIDKLNEQGVNYRHMGFYQDRNSNWAEASFYTNCRQERPLENKQVELWKDMFNSQIILKADATYGTFYCHLEAVDVRLDMDEIVRTIINESG